MQQLAFQQPVTLAIAENATSPDAVEGSRIWSSTAKKWLTYKAGAWVSEAGSGGAGGDVTIATSAPPAVVTTGPAALGAVTQRAAREDHAHAVPAGSDTQAGYILGSAKTSWDALTNTQAMIQVRRGDLVYTPQATTGGLGDDHFLQTNQYALRSYWTWRAATVGAPDNLAHTPRALQVAEHSLRTRYWKAAEPNSTGAAFAGVDVTTFGSVTGQPITSYGTTGTINPKRMRFGLASATAGLSAGLRVQTPMVFVRNSATQEGPGWFVSFRIAKGNVWTNAQHRMFIGITTAAALPNVNPSGVTGAVGFCMDSADNTLYGQANGTKAALSVANWHNTMVGHFDYCIYQPRMSNMVYFRAIAAYGNNWYTQMSVASTYTGVLAPQFWFNNGAGAVQEYFDVCSMYVETEW